MSRKKVHFHGAIRVDAYRVVSDAVEAGAMRGVRRAFKHADNPSQETIAQEVENAVMASLCEYLEFPEDPPSNPYVVEG
jgi:hypothetical protein